jgi:hypothetical protein
MLNWQDVEKLKSEGLHEWAGALAASLGYDDGYGVHFGMKSTRASCMVKFKQGWADATRAMATGKDE